MNTESLNHSDENAAALKAQKALDTSPGGVL